MCFVAEHGRHGLGEGIGNEVFADNHDDDASGADILLCAAVDHAVAADVHRFREEAGGNVRDERLTLGIGERMELCAIYGIILADIDIIGVIGDG